jgi:lipopolysaccharide export system protein LptC
MAPTRPLSATRVPLDLRPRAAGGPTGRWSRFVGWMKFGLPAAALTAGILVVAWPDIAQRDRSLPIAVAEPRPGEDDSLRMANPRYIGTDEHNRPYIITADTATVDRVDRRRLNLQNLQADMTLEDNRWISVSAPQGIYQQDRQHLTLAGPIEVYSDEGYELHAVTAQLDIQAGTAASDQPVRGHGPVGAITANNFRVDRKAQRLEFGGGVRLVIHPPPAGG